jgi:hypothetical protein
VSVPFRQLVKYEQSVEHGVVGCSTFIVPHVDIFMAEPT